MLLTLYTEEYFSAAHCIEGYDGKCSQLHGHSWKVCVWVMGDESQKLANGILWDFNNLKKITSGFDHTYLNDTLKMNPTVENITAYVYAALKKEHNALSFKVRVYENLLSKQSYCEAGDFP
jgi:6-pyruvoyltetrahydropterin/6-carboxytetrahydropterin synthase